MIGKKRVDLVNVAKAQKFLLYGILASFSTYVLFVIGGIAAPGSGLLLLPLLLVYFAAVICIIVGVIRLSRAVGTNIVMAVIAGILVFVPLFGLLIMLAENRRATKALKEAGVKVGLLGVSKEEMQKLVDGVCRSCGYDMRSLPGRACPECGAMAG